jgi:hypothetical protein
MGIMVFGSMLMLAWFGHVTSKRSQIVENTEIKN